MDVADAAQVAQVCQRLLAETERLDVLVNAAGILRMGATDQLSKEDWQQTLRSMSAVRLTCFSRP